MAYASIDYAESYFASRLYVDSWHQSTYTDKLKALEEATLRIDRLRFYGAKTNPTQILEFPRNDETEIPDSILKATCELAFSLLDGVNPEMEFENLSILGRSYSSVRAQQSGILPQDHIAAGIPNKLAWNFLVPFLTSATQIRLHRV